MEVMEIVLLVLGAVVFVGSFLIPAKTKNKSEEEGKISEEVVREMVGREVDDAKSRMDDIVNETITYAMEKTERAMDRLTNEKMMAVNEYSDTVLEEINKNHKEVIFLYDMLNEKQETLKSAVSEAVKAASQVKQTIQAPEQESLKPVAAEQESFEPIMPVQVILPSVGAGEAAGQTEEVRAADEEAAPKKSGRKPRALKSEETERKASPKAAPEGEVPEVTVSLNATGKAGARNNNERILELHKAGKSNMAIAKELGLGIGEVKLVIDLFEGI